MSQNRNQAANTPEENVSARTAHTSAEYSEVMKFLAWAFDSSGKEGEGKVDFNHRIVAKAIRSTYEKEMDVWKNQTTVSL